MPSALISLNARVVGEPHLSVPGKNFTASFSHFNPMRTMRFSVSKHPALDRIRCLERMVL